MVRYQLVFGSQPNHSPGQMKTPPSQGEFSTGQVDGPQAVLGRKAL